MNKKPHKHAEVIKAWADGAVIECRRCDEDTWIEVEHPGFYEVVEYRIKPDSEPAAPAAPATPYAEVFRALADGVPLTEFEYCWPGRWVQIKNFNHLGGAIKDLLSIRRRQKHIDINGFKVPEPLRAVEKGQRVWVALLCGTRDAAHSYCLDYVDAPSAVQILEAGIMHATKEAADLHGRALASFTEVKE